MGHPVAVLVDTGAKLIKSCCVRPLEPDVSFFCIGYSVMEREIWVFSNINESTYMLLSLFLSIL